MLRSSAQQEDVRPTSPFPSIPDIACSSDPIPSNIPSVIRPVTPSFLEPKVDVKKIAAEIERQKAEIRSSSPFPIIPNVALDEEIIDVDIQSFKELKTLESIIRPSSPFPSIPDITLHPEIIEKDIVSIRTSPVPFKLESTVTFEKQTEEPVEELNLNIDINNGIDLNNIAPEPKLVNLPTIPNIAKYLSQPDLNLLKPIPSKPFESIHLDTQTYELREEIKMVPKIPEFSYVLADPGHKVVENVFSDRTASSIRSVQSELFESQGHFNASRSCSPRVFVPLSQEQFPPSTLQENQPQPPPLTKIIVTPKEEIVRNPVWEEHVKSMTLANKEKSSTIMSQKGCFKELEEIQSAYQLADEDHKTFCQTSQKSINEPTKMEGENEITSILSQMKKIREGIDLDEKKFGLESGLTKSNELTQGIISEQLESMELGDTQIAMKETVVQQVQEYQSHVTVVESINEQAMQKENVAASQINTEQQTNDIQQSELKPSQDIDTTKSTQLSELESPPAIIGIEEKPINQVQEDFSAAKVQSAKEEPQAKNIESSKQSGIHNSKMTIQSEQTVESSTSDAEPPKYKKPPEAVSGARPLFGQLDVNTEFKKALMGRQKSIQAKRSREVSKNTESSIEPKMKTEKKEHVVTSQVTDNTKFNSDYKNLEKAETQVFHPSNNEEIEKIYYEQKREYEIDYQTIQEQLFMPQEDQSYSEYMPQSKAVSIQQIIGDNSKYMTDYQNNQTTQMEVIRPNPNEQIENMYYQQNRQYQEDMQIVQEQVIMSESEEEYKKVPVKSLIKSFEQSSMPALRYKQIRDPLPDVVEKLSSAKFPDKPEDFAANSENPNLSAKEQILRKAEEDFNNLYYVANSQVKSNYFAPAQSKVTTFQQSENSSFCRYSSQSTDQQYASVQHQLEPHFSSITGKLCVCDSNKLHAML